MPHKKIHIRPYDENQPHRQDDKDEKIEAAPRAELYGEHRRNHHRPPRLNKALALISFMFFLAAVLISAFGLSNTRNGTPSSAFFKTFYQYAIVINGLMALGILFLRYMKTPEFPLQNRR